MILRLLRKATVVLASGYILFFLSERVFWSFWRPGDHSADFLITWLVYSLIGWIFLDLVRRFRVASSPPLFLCGAVYGWVGEGIAVDTLYGDASNPLPLSVSWTGRRQPLPDPPALGDLETDIRRGRDGVGPA
jgi:hypothetical protein